MTNTHALSYNGAPYNEDATLINEATNITAGTGHALCSCGELSPELASGGARRSWFKEHKSAALTAPDPLDAALAELAAETTHTGSHDIVAELHDIGIDLSLQTADSAPSAETPDSADDLIGDYPPEEFRNTEASPHLLSLRDGPGAGTVVAVPFTDRVAGIFWGPLGKKGAALLLNTCYPDIKTTVDNAKKETLLTGPADVVAQAAEALSALYVDAAAAYYVWKRENAEYKGLKQNTAEGRRQSYRLTTDFFVGFANGWAADHAEAKDSGL